MKLLTLILLAASLIALASCSSIESHLRNGSPLHAEGAVWVDFQVFRTTRTTQNGQSVGVGFGDATAFHFVGQRLRSSCIQGDERVSLKVASCVYLRPDGSVMSLREDDEIVFPCRDKGAKDQPEISGLASNDATLNTYLRMLAREPPDSMEYNRLIVQGRGSLVNGCTDAPPVGVDSICRDGLGFSLGQASIVGEVLPVREVVKGNAKVVLVHGDYKYSEMPLALSADLRVSRFFAGAHFSHLIDELDPAVATKTTTCFVDYQAERSVGGLSVPVEVAESLVVRGTFGRFPPETASGTVEVQLLRQGAVPNSQVAHFSGVRFCRAARRQELDSPPDGRNQSAISVHLEAEVMIREVEPNQSSAVLEYSVVEFEGYSNRFNIAQVGPSSRFKIVRGSDGKIDFEGASPGNSEEEATFDCLRAMVLPDWILSPVDAPKQPAFVGRRWEVDASGESVNRKGLHPGTAAEVDGTGIVKAVVKFGSRPFLWVHNQVGVWPQGVSTSNADGGKGLFCEIWRDVLVPADRVSRSHVEGVALRCEHKSTMGQDQPVPNDSGENGQFQSGSHVVLLSQ